MCSIKEGDVSLCSPCCTCLRDYAQQHCPWPRQQALQKCCTFLEALHCCHCAHTHIFHTFCALSVLHLEVALQMLYRSIQCDSTVEFNTATVFAHGAVNQSAVARTSELFQMLPFQTQNSTWALWIVCSSIVSCASPLNDYLTQEPSQTQKSQTQEDCLVLQIISSSCSALRSA